MRNNAVNIPQSTPYAAPLRLVQLDVDNLERLTLSQPVELPGLSVCAGAVQRVLEIARENGAVDEVVAYTAPDNAASMKVLGRAGFERGAEVIDPCGELVIEWRIRIAE